MKQDINAMNKRYKKIEEKNTNLLKMMNTKQKESQPEIPTWASMSSNNPTNTYSVPTSNSFNLKPFPPKITPKQHQHKPI
jgi:uncharacterized protein (DUF885 family)